MMRPDITYGNPDQNCKLCLGHGVRPVDGMVVWCECQTEPVNGPLCTDADGKPVSLRKTDCFGGCGRYAYLAPLEGMRFTCSKCRPPEPFAFYSGEKCYEDALAGGHGTPPGEKPLFPPQSKTFSSSASGVSLEVGDEWPLKQGDVIRDENGNVVWVLGPDVPDQPTIVPAP